MSTTKVENYAHQHGVSNKEAKRRLGKNRGESGYTVTHRGGPVPGTGKPKGE